MDKLDRPAGEITPRLKLENGLEATPAAKLASADQSLNVTTGSVIDGRYTVIDFIGRGGMGTVHRVEQNSSGKQFALKLLNDGLFSQQEIARFRKEARAASMLDHPNIVRAVDSGMINDRIPYFVMELVQGETLAERLKRLGRLPINEALNILIPACFALDYAHKNGVVHRDLKPGNLILLGEGESTTIRIVDFGIAKLLNTEESQSLTATGQVIGSPLYMSPEQCRGSVIDHRADIYSMGCLAYEILTGVPPFIGDTALATMMMHLSQEPPRLKESSLGLEFPEAFEKVIRRALEKDPADRYASLAEMSRDLIDMNLSLAPAPDEACEQIRTLTIKRFPLFVWSIAGVVAVALCITSTIYFYTLWKSNQATLTANLPGQDLEKKRETYLDFADDPTSELRLLLGTIERYNKTLILNAKKIPPQKLSEIAIKCPNVETLSLTASKFSSKDLRAIERLPLKVLDLSETTVSDEVAPTLAKLRSLEELRLNSTNVTDLTLTALAPLQRLQILHLRHDRKITDKGFIALRHLRQLRVIQLTYTNVTDDSLKILWQLPNVNALGLAYTSITSACIPYLCKMSKLEFLAVEGNKALNYRDIRRLCDSLPNLNQIRAGGCSLQMDEYEKLKKDFPRIIFEEHYY